MLTPELVETLRAPINEASPCGDDLEYDPAFTALNSAAQGKPEQQFGDTVIPAEEPEWRTVSERAKALLVRTKDVRPAMLLLRASTHQQGVIGFDTGLRLLTGLLDTYWNHIHPQLDADDDNDPTMRLNALAPLADEAMVLRDLYEAKVGVTRSMGSVRVRDIAIAHNALIARAGESGPSVAQIQGALEEIHSEHPETLQTLMGLRAVVVDLQKLLADRTGRDEAVDLGRLRALTTALYKAATAVAGSTPAEETDPGATAEDAPITAKAAPASPRGEIQSRQDAVQMLDRVIRYLEQSEPGNPAPLLIERAKRLIGVSFFEIMKNLAPNAIDSIEAVTGKRPSE